MSEHTKLPNIVAAMKWLDAFDSCVYSGPEWAAEHARTIKAEIERLRSSAPAEDGEKVRAAARRLLAPRPPGRLWAEIGIDTEIVARAALSRGRDGRKS